MSTDSISLVQGVVAVAVRSAMEAGEAIMRVYGRSFAVEMKADNSPLTEADRASHDVIFAALAETPYPILSEEGRAIPYATRAPWDVLWLVDPLDGTKEFIKRNDEFTVNIALIRDGRPIAGVVYAPAMKDLYVGIQGVGAYRARGEADFQRLENALKNFPTIGNQAGIDTLGATGLKPPAIPVVASRSHNTPETDAFIDRLRRDGTDVALVSRGSALKLCMTATGEAWVYPRLAPTMEWDTAAAQAVVESAGGQVVVYDAALHATYGLKGPAALFEGAALTYNRENLLNPSFVCLSPDLRNLYA